MSEGKQTSSENDMYSFPLKYRLTGAIVWLTMLVILVPSWYNNPVKFDPDLKEVPSESVVLIESPMLLPEQEDKKSFVNDKASLESASGKVASTVSETAKNEKISESAHATSTSVEIVKQNITEKTQSSVTYQWVIRLVAYRQQSMAEALRQRLHYDYDAYVKFFPKSNYYSVRIGPYSSKEMAQKDQARLDELLRIQSELVKVKKSF